jgi:uncharacterized membrane protein YoaK (UPF0700 family)
MLVALTLVTGLVDAASYLRLGHVFVANMTGNVAFLGFALAGAPGLSAAASLIALGAFLLGALAGGWLAMRHSDHRGRFVRAVGIVQLLLMAAAVVVAALAPTPPDRAVRYLLTALLALAMGIQNAAAQLLAVPDLTTTVLTKTLTGIAAEAALVGGAGAKLGRRAIAVGTMLVGALIGGLLALKVSLVADVAVAFAVVSAVALAGQIASGASGVWTRP